MMPKCMPYSGSTRAGACVFAAALAPVCLAQLQPGATTLGSAAISLGDFEPQTPSLPTASTAWRAELIAWAWLMGLDGTVGVRGETIDVSAGIIDIAEASDSIIALSGRLEVGHGRLGAFVDAFYADLGVDDVSGPVDLASNDITYKQSIVDFGLMCRVAEWPLADVALTDPRTATIDLYAGGRFSKLELEFDPANAARLSDDKEWLDPIVGAKLVLPFAERWRLVASGDIGGFGVASDFTWSATGVLGYDFHLLGAPASLLFGYRATGWDYADGAGEQRMVWDVIQHGPLLGLSLRF